MHINLTYQTVFTYISRNVGRHKQNMRLIITYSFFILSLCSFSQEIENTKMDTVFIKYDPDGFDDILEYKTDTLLFQSQNSRHLLVGTTSLPETKNQMTTWKYGLQFEKVNPTECLSGNSISTDTINYIESTDSTLVIDVNVYDNCCFSFLCDVSIDNSGIMNLISTGYGGTCGCNCNFCLTFIFNKKNDVKYPNIEGVMVNGNRKSIKKFN